MPTKNIYIYISHGLFLLFFSDPKMSGVCFWFPIESQPNPSTGRAEMPSDQGRGANGARKDAETIWAHLLLAGLRFLKKQQTQMALLESAGTLWNRLHFERRDVQFLFVGLQITFAGSPEAFFFGWQPSRVPCPINRMAQEDPISMTVPAQTWDSYTG